MNIKYLIVGQGLAGTLLAYKMYRRGMDFMMVASKDISKASDVAAGLFNPLVFKRLTKSWYVDECLPAMFDTYREIEGFLNGKLLFEKDMIKPLAEEESELWRERIAAGNFSNYIKNICENKPIGGMHDFYAYGNVCQCGSLRLSKMLSEFRQWFNAKELLINERFEYDDLIITNEGIEWQGIRAEHIVFCEGYRVINNPFFKEVVLKPTKGELLEIYCEGLSQDYILNKKLFVMPVGHQKFKIGATYDWKNLNERTTEEARLDLLSRFEDLVSLPYSVLNQFAGIRPTVVDRRPVLGKHPTFNQLAIFNGLGTKGVMLAPFFANEMIRLFIEDNYSLNPEVNVGRFYK